MVVHEQTRQAVNEIAGENSSDRSASQPASVDVLSELIGVRLLASGKTTRSAVAKSLEPYFSDRADWNASAWRIRFDAAMSAAMEDGRIAKSPLRLTETGRVSATRFLGAASLASPRWTTLKNRYLVAVALGISLQPQRLERLGTAKGLYAAILAQHHALPTDSVPTETAALDALAWQQVARAHSGELPTGKRFTRNAVLAYAFFDGAATKNPALRLAAMATDAAPQADQVRRAVIGRWLAKMEPLEPQAEPSRQAHSHPELPDALQIGEFANKIRQLVISAEQGRFGRHKVFINHLWQRYRNESEAEIDRETFNAYLLESGRRGLLTLNRADLVEAMDPVDVRESEIQHANGLGTFHFVRTDQ